MMNHKSAITGVLALLSAAVLGLLGCGGPVGEKPKDVPAPVVEAPKDSGPSKDAPAPAPQPAKLPSMADLKLTLPKGWEAKFNDTLVEWRVTKEAPPDYPVIYIQLQLPERAPKDLEE